MSKTLTMPSAGENVEQQPSFTAARNVKRYSYFGRQADFYKTTHSVTIGSSNLYPRYLSK